MFICCDTNNDRSSDDVNPFDTYTSIYDVIIILLSLTSYILHILSIISLYFDSNSNTHSETLLYISIVLLVCGKLHVFLHFRKLYLTPIHSDDKAVRYFNANIVVQNLNHGGSELLPKISNIKSKGMIELKETHETIINFLFYFLLPQPLLSMFIYCELENEDFSKWVAKWSIFLVKRRHGELDNDSTAHDKSSTSTGYSLGLCAAAKKKNKKKEY